LYNTFTAERFREIVSLYSGYVYTIVFRLLGNRTDAEDATQETFIKAFKNLDIYDESKGWKNWLCTIALNTAKDYYRRSRRERILVDRSAPVEEFMDERAGESNPDDKLDIQKMLASLDLKYRTVIMLFYMEQRSVKEIAELLKKPENIIKIWLFRARKTILKLHGDTPE
jgi:RNA polymerase sigma-70 factor (ECF subfamily)